jgi:fatty-acyl-CoA synthase
VAPASGSPKLGGLFISPPEALWTILNILWPGESSDYPLQSNSPPLRNFGLERNGWTVPWACAAVGASGVCIPKVDAPLIWSLFKAREATHFCGAPTVLIMLINDPAAERLERPVRLFTAAAPPSPTIIRQMADLNFQLEHVYGLIETYGPFTINVPPPGFEALDAVEQARLRARQGVRNLLAGEVRVVDEGMRDVLPDGGTLGEVVMRGNVVMKGYYRDEAATEKAFAGGWFHSGTSA